MKWLLLPSMGARPAGAAGWVEGGGETEAAVAWGMRKLSQRGPLSWVATHLTSSGQASQAPLPWATAASPPTLRLGRPAHQSPCLQRLL